MSGKTANWPFKYCKKCGSVMRYDENSVLICIECIRYEVAINSKREKAQLKVGIR